jgi:hypothetical protein
LFVFPGRCHTIRIDKANVFHIYAEPKVCGKNPEDASDALVRFHRYTAHFPDDYDMDGVKVTALLTMSDASATDIRNFFTGLGNQALLVKDPVNGTDPSDLLPVSRQRPAIKMLRHFTHRCREEQML